MDRGSDTGQEDTQGLLAQFPACQASIRRMLVARLGNAADADDLMQDLWIKLAEQPSGPVASPSAYLHRMALNLANDMVRSRMRQRRRDAEWTGTMIAGDIGSIGRSGPAGSGGAAGHGATGGEGVIAVDPAPAPDRAAEGKSELARVAAALATLPPRSAEVFRLHRIDGRSHGDIAAELGISRSAVEKNMATALKYLMRALENPDSS